MYKKGFTLAEGATHVDMPPVEHRRSWIDVIGAKVCSKVPTPAEEGFTLAEVLITLGIIGVVAAMTIPTLIANINGARNRALFKETLSILNQAVRSNVANYGFDFASVDKDCNITNHALDNPETNMSRCAIFNANLKGYTHTKYNIATYDDDYGSNNDYKFLPHSLIALGYIPEDFNDNGAQYLLPNGTLLIFDREPSSCELPVGITLSKAFSDKTYLMETGLLNCIGFIDVNGTAPPNEEVTCSDGTKTAFDPEHPCVVKNDAQHMTDIFPVVFHNATVEPLTNAASYVLKTAK